MSCAKGAKHEKCHDKLVSDYGPDHLNDIDPYHIIETRIELRFLIIYDFFVKTSNLSRKKACLYLTIMKSHDQAELTVA